MRTEDPHTGVGVRDPHEHYWFKEPTEPVSNKCVTALLFAQSGAVGLDCREALRPYGPAEDLRGRVHYSAGAAALVVLPIKKVR
jgi:hypothetical protein